MVKREPFPRNIINFISNFNDVVVVLEIKQFSFVRKSREKNYKPMKVIL